MSWYIQVLKKYAVFSGPAPRKEYWFFALFNLIFSFVVVLIDYLAGLAGEKAGKQRIWTQPEGKRGLTGRA